MRASNSPIPPAEGTSSRYRPLLLPALVLVGGLVVGLLLFMLVWSIPALREAAIVLVLSIKKPVWFGIILLAMAVAAALVVALIRPYLFDTLEAEPASFEAGVPSVGTPGLGEPSIMSSAPPGVQRLGTPHPPINPVTPLPETMPRPLPSPPQEGAPEELEAFAAEALPKRTRYVPPDPSLQKRSWTVKPETLMSITLLGTMTLTLHLPGGRGTRQVPISAGNKRAQLLAFLACRRGESVHRDQILYHIFEWRREDGPTDAETMGGHFHSHAKLLRNDIKEIILAINEEAGEQLIDPNFDPFVNNNEQWSLSPLCEVVDLDEVERHYHVIEVARKEGLLTGEIPLSIKEACERLIEAYGGDFIADLIKKSPKDFKPWEGRASWARQYTTLYRSCYLSAWWQLGVFEEQQARRCGELFELLLGEGANSPETMERVGHVLGMETLAQIEQQVAGTAATRIELLLEELERRRRMYYGQAVDTFKKYALEACSTPYYTGIPFDEKVTYNRNTGRFGDRIQASEQALRRCLKACAFLNNTREAAEIYATYEAQMTSIFRAWGLVWKPSKETQKEWESVRALTNAHRFSPELPSKQAG
jgi:hypothetical protein